MRNALAGIERTLFWTLVFAAFAAACAGLAARGVAVDIDLIPLDDPKSYALYASAKTVAVFQVESSGMMDALRRSLDAVSAGKKKPAKAVLAPAFEEEPSKPARAAAGGRKRGQ